MGPRIVVQTEGKAGSYTVTRDERVPHPAFDVEVVDTTGAGDVFHGAYIVGLLHGWDLRRIAHVRHRRLGHQVHQAGRAAPIPCFDEAIDFLQYAAGLVVVILSTLAKCA